MLGLLTGCAGGGPLGLAPLPTTEAPTAPQASQWQQPHPAIEPSAQAFGARWWAALDDPALDALVAEALRQAPDLRIARSRLVEARARRDATAAASSVDIGATARASRSRTSGASGSGRSSSAFEVGFDASWEADVFGRLRAGVEAADADVAAGEASLADVQATLVAEVVRGHVALRSLRERRALADAQWARQAETLQIARWRARAGLVSTLDVLQAEAAVAQALAQQAALDNQLAATQLSLEGVVGLAPGALAMKAGQAGTLGMADGSTPWRLPGMAAIAIPADVLRRRPDVRMAEASWRAEVARTRQAHAAQFPRLSLNGSLGLQALTLGSLGQGGMGALAAALVLPLVDGGQLRAQLAAQTAVQSRAAVGYERAMRAALSDVEEALAALDTSRRQAAANGQALQALRQAAELAGWRYRAGLVDFRTVLDAERSRIGGEDSLAQSRTAVLTAWVQLHKALGPAAVGQTAVDSTALAHKASAPSMAGPDRKYPMSKDAVNRAASAMAVVGASRRRWPRLVWLLLALLLLGAGLWWWLRPSASEGAWQYRSTPAAVGALVVHVSATGNLQPTNRVDVGSELSGTVEMVAVDVNDRVRRGQVLARLDTARLADTVARSEAALAQAEAQRLQAQATVLESRAQLARLREVHRLSGGQVPAAAELSTAEATLERAVASEAVARATVQQAQAALRSDRTNLAKAQIRSPIDGVVLARKVEPGQTVAASLQAPTLFTLAENLAQMQLEVNVDEADVGQVAAGQTAQFSVDAYPDRRYPAAIQRVGLGAQTSNNVVSYLTVLKVDNADLSLRPGMTATAEITTLSLDQVLLVPNAALRWSPPKPTSATAAAASRSVVSSLLPRMPGGGQRQGNAGAGKPKRGTQQQVWVLGSDGQPQAVPVTVGATDGRLTQITGGALQAGQAVITDASEARR